MKRILVVDDMSMIRLYMKHILNSCGFEVDEASNGMEGLEKAFRTHYDLMFIDVNMPKMDGYSMIQALRRDFSSRSVPIIIISSEVGVLDKTQGFQSGANIYLTKPLKPELIKLFANILV